MSNEKKLKENSKKEHNELEGLWGIYNNLDLVPEERWDPFRTIIDETGNMIGHRTIISLIRNEKPQEYYSFKNRSDKRSLLKGEDSFCKIIKGELPAIVIAKDETVYRNPLSKSSSLENLQTTKVISIINLFSPLVRIFDPEIPLIFSQKYDATGIPIVHLFTEHYQSLEEIPEKILTLYLKNIILAIKSSHKAISSIENEISSIFHFYNIGNLAGASIPHLHSQTLLYKNYKGHGWKNQGFISANKIQKKLTSDDSYCMGCQYTKKVKYDLYNQELHLSKRIIWEDDHWMVFTAYAPERDAQLRILPKRHRSSLCDLNLAEIESLSRALLIANSALSKFIDEIGSKILIHQDRNLIFRQQFFDKLSQFHLLIDIIPIQQVGGAEIFDDYRISNFFPENVAQKMKSLIQKS